MADTTVSGGPWLRKRVDEVDQDFLRDLVKTVVEALMSVDADSVCGAPYGGPGQYGTASTTLVWIPKFRKKVLYGKLREHMGEILRELARQKESRVTAGDHR